MNEWDKICKRISKRRTIRNYRRENDRRNTGKIEEIFQEFLEGRNENSKKIADSVELYEKELEDFNRSMRAGITKESWFLEKLQDKAKGLSIDYLEIFFWR